MRISREYFNMNDLKPVRKVPVQSKSLSGKFPSLKNGRMIAYESQLELAFIYHLELLPTVYSYCEQPIKIRVTQNLYYIPDFLVKFTDKRKPVLVEVKYQSDVYSLKIYKKVIYLTKYALKNNLIFKLITEKALLTPLFLKCKFLFNYLNYNTLSIPQNSINASLNLLNELSFPTFAYLIIDLFSKKLNLTIENARTLLFHLLAKGKLFTLPEVQIEKDFNFLVYKHLPNDYKKGRLSWLF